MKRTQIYLDMNTLIKARVLARKQGKTVSQIVRNALYEFISKKEKPVSSLELILEMSKTIKVPKDTPKDLSTNLDKYLYSPK